MAPFGGSIMRPTRKISVCVVAISLGLLFACGKSVWPQGPKKANPRIKELQQKRLVVLELIHEAAKKSYESARTSFKEVHAAKVELLAARRDYADTRKDRIKACDEAVQEAIAWHTSVQGSVESGRAPRYDELKAQAFVLETQISRQIAETDE
jgi:hypothetical protein